MSYQFSDELIGQIAKSLQIAVLTGTDIVDHLRQLYVEIGEDGKIVLTPEFNEMFESQLASMLDHLAEWEELQESGQAMSPWTNEGPVED